MDKPMSNFEFRIMSWKFKSRYKPEKVEAALREVGFKPGAVILDFGCGPGGYTLATAEKVGESGKVYAVDIHPLAVKKVRRSAAKRGLRNIEVIHSDCETGLKDSSVDIVILYDVFHEFSEREKVLKELHRVMRDGAELSFSDHHLEDDEVVREITKSGLFKFVEKGEKTHKFMKVSE